MKTLLLAALTAPEPSSDLGLYVLIAIGVIAYAAVIIHFFDKGDL